MNLLQRVCEILDFPDTQASLAVNEACNKEKLQNTYMKVNGHVLYMDMFDFDNNEIITENKIRVFVSDLDVFTPEAGLYTDGYSCLLLKKYPKKHWQKSFNYSTYSTKWIHISNTNPPLDDPAKFIGMNKRVLFFRADNGSIFHNKEVVATEMDGVCTVSNPLFYQELLDWITKEKLPWKIQ